MAQLIVCPSGAWRSGVWMMYDSECERMRTKQRVRFSDSLRQLRLQRGGAIDNLDLFTGLVDGLCNAAKTYKKK